MGLRDLFKKYQWTRGDDARCEPEDADDLPAKTGSA